MIKRMLLSTILAWAMLAGPRAVHADGLGVGVQSMQTDFIGGPLGASLTFDQGEFHIDGILGLFSNADFDGTLVHLGARFYYTVHQTGVADLSVGGGLGLTHLDIDPADDTDIHLEGGLKLRIWLVSNVTLSSTVGLGLVLDDGDNALVFGGQFVGQFGLTYYFN